MFKYGLKLRPVGISTVPQGFTIIKESTEDFRHGVISYKSKLSNEDINNFELIDLSDEHFKMTTERISAKLAKYASKYLESKHSAHFRNTVIINLDGSYSNKIDSSRIEELIEAVREELKSKVKAK
ncbi:defense against restriction DarA-related protein [Poseidonibacter ostreae]|uniref:Defence against restriction A C-terminal domain-containing protein n=1 Tax=Poseidonibacter ostreae TaxID=2654171 RepID=A0A6L4WWY5_9BACT|nr:hypothetical protein [Poseidonibacter ostreae]KAB7891369.1 hypothetical protein GBG19_00605 [Poseidonibacter ostreae]